MLVRKHYADYQRDNGTVQRMEIDNMDITWLKDHANQILATSSEWVELVKPCKDCGVEEMPNAFMQYCDTCFRKKTLN